jgi:hypothetical protein
MKAATSAAIAVMTADVIVPKTAGSLIHDLDVHSRLLHHALRELKHLGLAGGVT